MTHLTCYIGGQLKYDPFPEIGLSKTASRRRSVQTLYGEIENISVDGLQVEVRLAWAARKRHGCYVLAPDFDLNLGFEVELLRKDANDDIEIITEQDELIVFYEPSSPRIIAAPKTLPEKSRYVIARRAPATTEFAPLSLPPAIDVPPGLLPPEPQGIFARIGRAFRGEKRSRIRWLERLRTDADQRLVRAEVRLNEIKASHSKAIADYNTRLTELTKQLDVFLLSPRDINAEIEYAIATEQNRAELLCFLQKYTIKGTRIYGLRPARKLCLYEHGVNTAADVTAEKIRVISGFGDALTTQLVAWRQKLERDFHFARFQQPVADVESLLARVTQSCSNALDQFHAEAVSLSRERDQSRADLQSLADKIREQGTD